MNKFTEYLEMQIEGCKRTKAPYRDKIIYQLVLDEYKKQLTLTDVVHTLKDCLIAQKPVEYNGKKYYVSKLDIMQNGDEFCDLIDIETYDCIDDIKSTEVKIF